MGVKVSKCLRFVNCPSLAESKRTICKIQILDSVHHFGTMKSAFLMNLAIKERIRRENSFAKREKCSSKFFDDWHLPCFGSKRGLHPVNQNKQS
jgi:hypothetical protein